MKFARLAIMSAITLACTVIVHADDISGLKEELLDVRAKVASMEAARMAPAAGGDAESLTSMKKKGSVKIGGYFFIDVVCAHRDDAVNAQNSSSNDKVDSTSFFTNDADLDFKIEASADTFLMIKLDLDDAWNSNVDQDDLLEECYFVWENLRGSQFSLLLGKAEAPYGQDKDVMITKSYHSNSGIGSHLGRATEERAGPGEGPGTGNPHLAVGNFSHPGEQDNVFQITGSYKYKDLLKLEVALFQNDATTGGSSRGMHEDRSDDTLFFQSMASRITYTPFEGLALKASVINEHCDSRGDNELRTDLPNGGKDAKADQTAVSLAFDYTMRNIPLEFFGEYQHGWNWNYDDEYSIDIVQVGGIYGLTGSIDMQAAFEWCGIDSGNNSANNRDNDEDYYKAVAVAKYKLNSGVALMFEYLHEWYDNERVGNDGNQEADVISFRTMWMF